MPGPVPRALHARLLLQEPQLMLLSMVREGGGATPYLSSESESESEPAPRPSLTRRVPFG
ncbi:hypothetical protein [Streptomyces sp. NPDC055140]